MSHEGNCQFSNVQHCNDGNCNDQHSPKLVLLRSILQNIPTLLQKVIFFFFSSSDEEDEDASLTSSGKSNESSFCSCCFDEDKEELSKDSSKRKNCPNYRDLSPPCSCSTRSVPWKTFFLRLCCVCGMYEMTTNCSLRTFHISLSKDCKQASLGLDFYFLIKGWNGNACVRARSAS